VSKEFEIARLQMIKAARDGDIDRARGYAWAHRICPFDVREIEEKFQDDFKIGRDAADDVLLKIEDGWRSNKPVTFYDLERFGGQQARGLHRMDIYHVCRLAFLDGRFDTTVWTALTKPGSGPIETQGMAREFRMDDDINY
jgi:hypothetical protein